MFTNKHNSLIKPPERLFGVIIRRLKLEKSLKAFRERFSISLAALAASAALIAIAIIAFNIEMAESESTSFVSLIFSDTLAIIAYYKYFIIAVLESMPVVSINASLAAILLLMVSLRFVFTYYDKILELKKSIKQ